MQIAYRGLIVTALGLSLGLAGCAGMGGSAGIGFIYKNLAVADGSAVAGEGNNVLFKGSPLGLSGAGVKTGDAAARVRVDRRSAAAGPPRRAARIFRHCRR